MNEGRENYDNDNKSSTDEDKAADEAAKSAGNEEVKEAIEKQNEDTRVGDDATD